VKDHIEELHELCETVSTEIAEANKKIRSGNGKLSAGDVEYLDKLTHMLKSIKTTIAMIEADEEDGYSHHWPVYYGRSYAEGEGRGVSHARGRNTRRDSMGRYSRTNGYSYADGMEDLLSEMRDMMGDMPEEKRREVQRFIDKMERM
jgi:hypothetical protein